MATSLEIFFEFSKLIIKSISSKISPLALANLNNKSDSKSFNLILNSFYSLIKSIFFLAKSGLSLPTTSVNNWSPRPISVTVKFIKAASAYISGG